MPSGIGRLHAVDDEDVAHRRRRAACAARGRGTPGSMSVHVLGRLGDVRVGGDDRVAGSCGVLLAARGRAAALRDRRRRGRPRGSRTPFTTTARMPVRVGHQAVGAGGEVAHAPQRASSRRSRDRRPSTSAARPGARRPRSARPNTVGGLRRQPAHAVLEREHAASRAPSVPSSSVGAQASQSWLACAPASERPSMRRGMRRAARRRWLVGVQHGHAEARLEIGREREIEHEVDGVHAALRRDLAEVALGERRVGRVLGDLHVGEAAAERPRVAALAQRAPELGIGVDALLARAIRLRDRLEERHALERERRLHLELDSERPAGDLRDDRDAVAPAARPTALEHAAMAVGSEHAAEQRRPRHRAAGARARWRRARRGRSRGRSSPASRRGRPRRDSRRASRSPRATPRGSAPAGPRSRRASATSRSRSRARRRAARRATRARMRRDLVGRRLALGRLLAHHVQADRRVADERADVDRRAAALDRVEELGKGLERPVARRRRRAARRATCPRRSRACAGSARGAPGASARRRSRSCPSPPS